MFLQPSVCIHATPLSFGLHSAPWPPKPRFRRKWRPALTSCGRLGTAHFSWVLRRVRGARPRYSRKCTTACRCVAVAPARLLQVAQAMEYEALFNTLHCLPTTLAHETLGLHAMNAVMVKIRQRSMTTSHGLVWAAQSVRASVVASFRSPSTLGPEVRSFQKDQQVGPQHDH